jgi:collagenase-like PrtC family protease
MKFAVGYQLPEDNEEPMVDIINDYKDYIAQVYFPWNDMPSGRAALTSRRGYVNWSGQKRLEQDLVKLRNMGMKLDLLFNANCYGGKAVSEYLRNCVASVLERLQHIVGGVDIVTTTSLFIAKMVKTHFPDIEVRSSVNMRIGTIDAMKYVTELFDSYYMQREYNRNLTHIKQLKQWADANGKKLYMLANSGCLAWCPGQIFHDNLVAHEQEIDETKNVAGYQPHVCWNLFSDRKNWPAVLTTTWIRPEDLHHYDKLFDVVKLATRMHSNPRMVIDAYVKRSFEGNLLELFEPGFAPAFQPYIMDNKKFPAEWFERTSTCNRQCHQCNYCKKIMEKVMYVAE